MNDDYGSISDCYVVVDEHLRVVYRGTCIDTCSEYLRPGKMVGNIFGVGKDMIAAENAAKDKMREALFNQRQAARLKAAVE